MGENVNVHICDPEFHSQGCIHMKKMYRIFLSSSSAINMPINGTMQKLGKYSSVK
jgi:hypothetical protein